MSATISRQRCLMVSYFSATIVSSSLFWRTRMFWREISSSRLADSRSSSIGIGLPAYACFLPATADSELRKQVSLELYDDGVSGIAKTL